MKQLAGTIKALWHKSPELWSMGFVPSGRYTAALGYKSHTTRNPWYNYNFTLYSLQCTPQPTIPINQSYYSQQVHTTIPKQRIGNYGVCGWKDPCRDGNLRTYCHVSPILFGCFFVEASPTSFCIFVKCFIFYLLYYYSILSAVHVSLLYIHHYLFIHYGKDKSTQTSQEKKFKKNF